MAPVFRIIDTGLRDGRANIAFDQALIEAHQKKKITDTIRFLQFPPTALIGRHQALSQEIRLDHCRENGIGVGRRITGGGTIFFDEGQLGWELVFHRQTLGTSDLAELTQSICEAAAAGLSGLGIAATFRPRSDIVVDGRKLCGTGGYFDGDTLFYQGTLLIDMDPAAMIAALNVPEAKEEPQGSAAQRVVTLRELLGDSLPDLETIKEALLTGFRSRLGLETEGGEITQDEENLAQSIHDEEIGTDAFVAEIDDPAATGDVRTASRATPGGTVSAFVRLEGPEGGRIREVLLAGDFFAIPPRTVYDLEAHLRGSNTSDLTSSVDSFFAALSGGLLTVPPADVCGVIQSAIDGAP